MGKITAKCQETKELLLCLSELSQEEPIAYFKNKGISTAVLNQGKGLAGVYRIRTLSRPL